jgi:pilus assembly protein CpaD
MTRISIIKAVGAISLLALSVGACAPDRVITGSTYPTDFRERHPIVLEHAPKSLDVFVEPGGIDPRQRDDIEDFAIEYRRYGEGAMKVEVPSDARAPTGRSLAAVRSALARSGVSGSRITVSTYVVEDPALASPIHLSFQRMQAKVGSRCGLWPQDLGVSNAKFNASNDPYWNLGCAMQSNVASQVADPVDLVRGRSEARVDTVRRMENIKKLREAQDPSTQYRAQDDKISKALGQ